MPERFFRPRHCRPDGVVDALLRRADDLDHTVDMVLVRRDLLDVGQRGLRKIDSAVTGGRRATAGFGCCTFQGHGCPPSCSEDNEPDGEWFSTEPMSRDVHG